MLYLNQYTEEDLMQVEVHKAEMKTFLWQSSYSAMSPYAQGGGGDGRLWCNMCMRLTPVTWQRNSICPYVSTGCNLRTWHDIVDHFKEQTESWGTKVNPGDMT